MGWDFAQGATKADIVRGRTETKEHGGTKWQTVKHKVVGKVLWQVLDIITAEKTERIIACYLLESQRGYGWGYKSMSEACGPFDYSCPLEFLDLAPEVTPWWRARVRLHHAEQKALKAALRHGGLVKLRPGFRPVGAIFEITNLKPLRGVRRDDAGGVYRLNPSQLLAADWNPPFDPATLTDSERFEREHATDFLVLSAWGDWKDGVPQGQVAVFAKQGGRTGNPKGEERYFLIPGEVYEKREGEFIVDTTVYPELNPLQIGETTKQVAQ